MTETRIVPTQKSFLIRSAIVAVAVASTTALVSTDAAAQTRITIKGGQVNGAFNRTASAWAAYVSKNVTGLSATAEASAGSLDNTRTVNSGEAEMGIAFASELYQGYRGVGSFKKEQKNIRGITFLFGSVGHFVVPAGSDIKKLEDIAGKTISMGGPGSGSAKSLTALLKHAGLWGKFKPVYAGKKSPAQLKNGKVAAYNWHPGLGNAMIRDTATSMKIRFVDMDATARSSGFYDKFPYFSTTKIPAGTYPNVDVDTATFGTGTLMITNKNVPAETVYRVTSAIYSADAKKFLVSAAGKTANQMTTANAFRTMTIPLHAGAQKFFKEQGVSIPAGVMASK